MLETISADIPKFLFASVRCFALLMTLPLFSMRNISKIAKIAVAGYMAYIVLPYVNYSVYNDFLKPDAQFSLEFLLLLIGEALIGIITGFYISIIFSAFSTAGQFFAFQIGFSASEVYDSLSQVENPLMGQYLNLIAMLVFLQTRWFQKLFLGGLVSSFQSISAYSLVQNRMGIVTFMMHGLTDLFASALVISLPIMGSLLLITITTGILSKAAPQMNLLSEGFPIMMMTAFFILTVLMPDLCDFFFRSFNAGFARLEQFFLMLGGRI